jgi:hypothetical protein
VVSFIDRQGCELRMDKPSVRRIRVPALGHAQVRRSVFLMSRKRPMEMKKTFFSGYFWKLLEAGSQIQRILRFPLSSAARYEAYPVPPFLLPHLLLSYRISRTLVADWLCQRIDLQACDEIAEILGDRWMSQRIHHRRFEITELRAAVIAASLEFVGKYRGAGCPGIRKSPA